MVNDNYSLVTVMLLVLVGAVIASIITASITGNVIKVKEDKKSKNLVYTTNETYSKEEINTLLDGIDFELIRLNSSLNNVRAVSCDKDGVCEVYGDIKAYGNVLRLSSTRGFVTILNNLSASDVTINGRLLLWNGRSGLERPTNPNKTYYLCVAEDSNVYRSTSPCV